MKRAEVDYNELSPMMQQYFDIKNEYEEELLFFRLGDFYELFFEDGITAARELELTLTGKNAGLKERIPMCGVPFHAVKPYIEKLIAKGYKVAICEQLENPKDVKGMVKRGVVQVISKGTIVDLESLNEHDNNYLGSVIDLNYAFILTYFDISTGELATKRIAREKDKLINEILCLNIKELLVTESLDPLIYSQIKKQYGIIITYCNEFLTDQYQNIYRNIEDPIYIEGITHLLYYLVKKQLKDLSHVDHVIVINNDDYLLMDNHTIRNLELIETIRLKDRTYSLLWFLDHAKTAMGSRKIKNWLLFPLKDQKLIEKRYDMIAKINTEFLIKEELKRDLYEIYDIERLCSKIVCGNPNARDLLQLKFSLQVLPMIADRIKKMGLNYKINCHSDIYSLLEKAVYEDPPVTLREGYLIKEGYNQELDKLKNLRSGGKEFISTLENTLREETNIKTLKVGFNKVFGYYIEISKGQIKAVKPEWNWERRQTLADKERYITPLLKEKEALVLNAEEKIVELEYQLFLTIKEIIKKDISLLKKTANTIAEIDAIVALATISEENNLVRPIINNNNEILIEKGRHPVIENVNKTEYIANDCKMTSDITTLLITGPNMSGKSTYMRQLAIIIIMAQMGCYVPASKASLPVFDKIFTRIGASDDLVSGESTFMVEMLEARNAIVNATNNSLILFDELGRGTATYDGMSIAEAILEYINEHVKCKTLFSTHYHELTNMDKRFPSIKNIHVSALEENGNIIFLHKIKDGSVDKSYGIHVAALAKMPGELLKRANEILLKYETVPTKAKLKNVDQLAFNFDQNEDHKLNEKIKSLNLFTMTPLEAINTLDELKKMVDDK